jgi:hypothetical protein
VVLVGVSVVATTVYILPGAAVTLTWTLQNGVFDDGGTASGKFDYDTDTNIVSNWNILVMGGSSTFPSTTYSPSNSRFYQIFSPVEVIPNTFGFMQESGDFIRPRDLRFAFDSPLPASGGTVDLIKNTYGSAECYNCAPYRELNGSLIAFAPTSVSEPENVFSLGGLIWVAGFLLRKRLKFSQIAQLSISAENNKV